MPALRSLAQLPRVLVIAGCTGVGKSSAAIRASLAVPCGGEIVSADSVQIYKGLDIGSAKVSPDEQALVPHHLIDIADPATDAFTVGEFVRRARCAIDSIHRSGKLPVVCGGTGYYMSGLLYGLPDTPARSESATAVEGRIRSELDAERSWSASIARLEAVDPVYARTLHTNDYYRLARALSVFETTGRRVSDSSWRKGEGGPGPGTGLCAVADVRCHFLHADRIKVYRTVDQRCEQMIVAGLIKETSALVRCGRLSPSSNAGRSIGYAHTLKLLASAARVPRGDTAAVVPLFREYLAQFQRDSRQLCRRQMVWYRSRHDNWYFLNDLAAEDLDRALLVNIQASPEEFALRRSTHGSSSAVAGLNGDEQKLMKRYRVVNTVFSDDGAGTEAVRACLADAGLG